MAVRSHLLAVAAMTLALCNCGARTSLIPYPGGESAPDTTTSTDAFDTAPSTCAPDCADELSESCTAAKNLGAFINDGVRFLGQVYTAGHTGTLSGVQISVRSNKWPAGSTPSWSTTRTSRRARKSRACGTA